MMFKQRAKRCAEDFSYKASREVGGLILIGIGIYQNFLYRKGL